MKKPAKVCRIRSPRRGTPPLDSAPLKVLLGPDHTFSEAAQVLKRQLDDESLSMPCSISEYVVRILLGMTTIERLSRARAAGPSVVPAEQREVAAR